MYLLSSFSEDTFDLSKYEMLYYKAFHKFWSSVFTKVLIYELVVTKLFANAP